MKMLTKACAEINDRVRATLHEGMQALSVRGTGTLGECGEPQRGAHGHGHPFAPDPSVCVGSLAWDRSYGFNQLRGLQGGPVMGSTNCNCVDYKARLSDQCLSVAYIRSAQAERYSTKVRTTLKVHSTQASKATAFREKKHTL